MVPSFSIAFCALILVALIWEARAARPERMALSPFWYFSFLVIIAFPVRAYLLDADLVSAQVFRDMRASDYYPSAYLSWALGYVFLLWVCIYWGRKKTVSWQRCKEENVERYFQSGWKSHLYIDRRVWVFIGVAIVAIIAFMLINDFYRPKFTGVFYQKNRFGMGLLWVLPEFFVWAAVGILAFWGGYRDHPLKLFDYVLLALIFGLSVWFSGGLHTRRLVGAIVLLYVVVFVLRAPRFWYLSVLGILSTVFFAPFLDWMRTIYNYEISGSVYNFSDISQKILMDRVLYSTSGAFEGAGHVARLLEQASFSQLILGIDHGLSWLFNAGLALVPRSLWEGKPLTYGGIEQFQWLYPQLFSNGYAESSVPMSFAVDFAFGFGVPAALVLAYVFGRFLGVMERALWDRSAHVTQVALALYIFIFTFNWVRGGSILLQSVALFSIALVMMYGLRSTLASVLGSAGEALGLVGGDWRGAARVFFYPHAYLRARQLDTVRHWSGPSVVNPRMPDNRQASNVSREKALTPSKPSWKRRLPLVNIKRRPKEAPADAAVYVWGGLINKGPFITDIDNPFAFTGYNVFAARLFRPVIQSFLESPRCLQIRCMSQACLDGVRREYGDSVAEKAVVIYPHIEPQVASPKQGDTSKCRFAFVSSQFEIKGGEALLNAFAKVSQACPGAELDLVTYLPDRFQGQAAKLPNVRVIDADLSREDVGQRILSQSDVLVHPTYMDSFGMVVLEAMSYGLPVIATDVYALREMVEDGRNGRLLNAPISSWDGVRPSPYFSNVQKLLDALPETNMQVFEQNLADAMIAMCQDADLRAQSGQASLELLRSRFAPS